MDDMLRIHMHGTDAAIAGELDASQRDRLLTAFAVLEGHAIRVDLKGLTFVDSEGLRALIDLRRAHPSIEFVEPSKAVLRIVRVVEPGHYLFDEVA